MICKVPKAGTVYDGMISKFEVQAKPTCPSPQNRLRNWSSSTSHFAFGFFVHEPLPAPCAQKAIRSSTTATMSPADQNSHTSVQGGAGPSSRRSNPSKIPQKFGGRGRGGGRGKKRDMGRGEWRCVRYNDTCWHGRDIDWLKQNESG
jgi:hypothetical protein